MTLLREFNKLNQFTSFVNGDFIGISIDQENLKAAIEAADEAYNHWRKVPSPLRADWLRKLESALLENKEELANRMALEMGKPIKEGVAEVEYAAGYFKWYAGEAERIYGCTIPSQFSEKELKIIYEPIGVSAIITPWNFPLAMAARKIAAALAAGCTTLIKPSPESPVTLLDFAFLCRQINLPKGVVNIVIGEEKSIGNAFLSSPIVQKLSFTGSTEVGKELYQRSADTLKKLTLELGGHAPLIVFDDADLDHAVHETIQAKFRNNGQTCVSPNRFLIQEGIKNRYIEKLIEKIKQLKIGDPLDPKTDISTILHPLSLKKIENHLKDALEKGAKTHLRGKIHEPAILSDVTKKMIIFHEETFGPLVPITTFKTAKEAIKIANDTPYGLAAYVFTQNLERAGFATNALDYGFIGLNDGLPSSPQAALGGRKSSGFGSEGGPTGIYEYLQEKFISLKHTQNLHPNLADSAE